MPSPATEIDVDGVMVRVTNPDKPFCPELGSDGTKGKLIDYYRAVASGPMLTALRDRPTHLQRFPDGIDGEEVYQKRVPQKHPDYLETCTVTFPSGRTADALKITHPAAIGKGFPSPAGFNGWRFIAGPLAGMMNKDNGNTSYSGNRFINLDDIINLGIVVFAAAMGGNKRINNKNFNVIRLDISHKPVNERCPDHFPVCCLVTDQPTGSIA